MSNQLALQSGSPRRVLGGGFPRQLTLAVLCSDDQSGRVHAAEWRDHEVDESNGSTARLLVRKSFRGTADHPLRAKINLGELSQTMMTMGREMEKAGMMEEVGSTVPTPSGQLIDIDIAVVIRLWTMRSRI